ncbi:hypothetical protein VFPFJ_04043 [Purpureocillium lilacinum]|uniref:Uncharacterized protein n=1 Tax=Purpureocillium lilacinum TaxID=33203 RepID=A0A179HSG6_PURLI|nr:hypothetical protein VFPFJ_04043 [Purpureocillium lilacinum]OAQ82265.1 hypothetical protein VFPBJ_04849 [Purpureocillium lilacinum]OAQ92303.1 hypothetical protein VFPFJ_04043 [Purpureocillium lilacinum]
MTGLKPSSFPHDTTSPLHPTTHLSISHPPSSQSTLRIAPILSTHQATPSPTLPVLAVTSSSSLSRTLTCRAVSDDEGHDDTDDGGQPPLATLSSPLLAFGRWTISFSAAASLSEAAGSGEGEARRRGDAGEGEGGTGCPGLRIGDIELHPVSSRSSADVFVLSGVPFFWERGDGATRTLHKVVNGRKVDVAIFTGRRTRDAEGVMAVDETHVNALVAAVTCVAVLKRTDSFRM